MKPTLIFTRATDFGTVRSRKDLFSFTLKTFIYIIVALILGDYTDKIVLKCRTNKVFGENMRYYILLQTTINILTLYLFILFFPGFMSEFQSTMPGVYFVTLYFGMQTNYMSMLKKFMNTFM